MYERPYYEDLDYRPFLFYVVFGTGNEQLEISEYMEALIGGTLGKILNNNSPYLYEAIQKTDTWCVLKGEIESDSDLNYMKNAIGIIQAIVEKGGISVLDLQTIILYTQSEWTNKIFEPDFNPYSHVVILTSEMDNGSIWLHTRGMRKFGRPDISIEELSKNQVDNAAQVINQLIFYSALGAFFSRPVKLHTHNGLTCIAKLEFVSDIDNPDFNNSYYRVLWDKCEFEL